MVLLTLAASSKLGVGNNLTLAWQPNQALAYHSMEIRLDISKLAVDTRVLSRISPSQMCPSSTVSNCLQLLNCLFSTWLPGYNLAILVELEVETFFINVILLYVNELITPYTIL